MVVAKIKGAYLAYPRWAKPPRRDKINLAYKPCLADKETKVLSLVQIEYKQGNT